MHTFGVGSGADADLIKRVATAGFGHFTFINKISEIEEKVISALTKTLLFYTMVKSAQLFDQEGEVVHSFPEDVML